MARGHAWRHHSRADDLITGGLCPWVRPLARIPASPAMAVSPHPHPAPSNRQPSVGECEEGWGLHAGLGTAQGWPWGAAGPITPGWTWGTPAQRGRASPPVGHPGSGSQLASWQRRCQGRGRGLCVLWAPLSLPGPPPGNPVGALESETKAREAPGGPRRAGTQAGDGVLMTEL